jgi:hypothetical protein
MSTLDHFRAYARHAVHFGAVVRDGTGRRQGRLSNVGLGGACVEVAGSSTQLGSIVSVEVMAPHLWDPLVIEARVAWCMPLEGGRRCRLGLCFEHRSGPVLRALLELLGSNLYE